MRLERFKNDDSAVSPVIGVILMVAITVILAAVIASFVLGLSPGTSTTPTASFSADTGTFGNDETALNITMDSGQDIEVSNIKITGDYINSNNDYIHNSTGVINQTSSDTRLSSSPSEQLSAGDTIYVAVEDSYEVSLVYESGDTSSTMQTFES